MNATTAGCSSATAASISYLEAATRKALQNLADLAPGEDDAHSEGVLDILRWIRGGGTFADANAAAAALRRRTCKHLAAAQQTTAPADAGHDDYLWVPAGPDPERTALDRDELRRTLTALQDLPALERGAVVSDASGEPAGDFTRRMGWSRSTRRRAAARGRDTLRDVTATAA